MTNGGVFVICAIISFVRRRIQKKTYPILEARHHLYMTLFGAMQGLEIGFINMALSDSALSMRTMVMSTNTMFMLFCAQCWGLPPKLTRLRFACMLLFVAGGVSQGLSAMVNDHEGEKHPVRGFFVQILSMTIAAQRWALIQWSLREGSPIKQLSKIEVTARMIPAGVACLAVMVAIGEPEALYTMTTDVFLKCVLLSALIAVLIVTELRCVQLTNAVTFFVCGVVHNIPIILCGVWFFGEDLHTLALFGFFLCIVGTFWYAKLTPLSSGRKGAAAVYFDPIDEFDPSSVVTLDFDDLNALEKYTDDMTVIMGKTAPVAKKKKGIGINLKSLASSKSSHEKEKNNAQKFERYTDLDEENEDSDYSPTGMNDSRASTPVTPLSQRSAAGDGTEKEMSGKEIRGRSISPRREDEKSKVGFVREI